MLNTIKSAAILLSCFACLSNLHAQDRVLIDSDHSSKNENIVIHKNGPSKEKVTVVIDGDNVTVNGKPIDDFVSDDIEITKQDAPDLAISGDNLDLVGTPALPPMAPRVKIFRNDMISKMKSNSAFLGVMSEKTDKGAKITDITKGSSAEKGGLQTGDIITKINDLAITGPNDLYKAIGKYKPDAKVNITYLRDGKQSSTQATLTKANEVRVYSWNQPGDTYKYDFDNNFKHNFSYNFDMADRPRLGVEVQDTEDGSGVKITDLGDDDAPASKAGLKEDDVITQVNGKTITSVDDLKQSMKDVKKGDTLKVTYKRNGQVQTTDIKFPKELKTMDL